MTASAQARAWELVVGLEVHVQLASRTKLFCRCATDFGAPANANTCPVCLGLPGTLPVLNQQAVSLAVRAALALGCDVQPRSIFARKHYFYPDLPKGYQISQFDLPLALHGSVTIGHTAEGADICIGIARLHLEEDAGKSVHDRFPGLTAIDLNRAGVPLIEIVSRPDMRSREEVSAYLAVLKQTLEYLGVSDVSMERGSLRVDANISTRRLGDTALGTRTEIKNLNSFSALDRALGVEFERQVALREAGGTVRQETLLWNDAASALRPARSKEDSPDYRYFPDPDLPPLLITAGYLDRVRDAMPELPADRVARFAREYSDLTPYDIQVLTSTRALGEYFEHVARAHGNAKTAANWVMGELFAALNATGETVDSIRVRPADLAELLTMQRDGFVSGTAAKRIFASMLATGDRPSQIAEREGLVQVDDAEMIDAWIDAVFAELPHEVERYLAGEKRLQGVLVGAVMKKSGGRADPKRVNQMLVARVAEV